MDSGKLNCVIDVQRSWKRVEFRWNFQKFATPSTLMRIFKLDVRWEPVAREIIVSVENSVTKFVFLINVESMSVFLRDHSSLER